MELKQQLSICNSGLHFGRQLSTPQQITREEIQKVWNGTSWTEVGDLNTARDNKICTVWWNINMHFVLLGGKDSGDRFKRVKKKKLLKKKKYKISLSLNNNILKNF